MPRDRRAQIGTGIDGPTWVSLPHEQLPHDYIGLRCLDARGATA